MGNRDNPAVTEHINNLYEPVESQIMSKFHDMLIRDLNSALRFLDKL